MNFILINSNNGTSFVAAYLDGRVIVKYASDFLQTGDSGTSQDSTLCGDFTYAFQSTIGGEGIPAKGPSANKLAHCLKFITEEIRSVGIGQEEIDVISVITGPGSFTGIRVGLALAKGYADSLGKKIIPVDNFELILKKTSEKIKSKQFCILIPAKLPEYYFSLFENNMEIDRGCIGLDDFLSKFDKGIQFVSDFSDDYIKNLGYFNFLDSKYLGSELDSMIALVQNKFLSGLSSESGKIEPVYLKDFAFRKI